MGILTIMHMICTSGHMGYEDINMQPLLERKLRQNADIPRLTYPSSLSFKEIARFDNRVNDLWETAKNGFKTIVVRNDQFLNWRYISRPDIHYHVYGAYDHEKTCWLLRSKALSGRQNSAGSFLSISLPSPERSCTALSL